jgi:hypothetical protein
MGQTYWQFKWPGLMLSDDKDREAEEERRVNEDILAIDMIMHNEYRYVPLHDDQSGREAWPHPHTVTLSPHDRSRQVRLVNKCRTLVHQDPINGGYRSAMATHGLRQGTAYFEALLEAPNVRLGIAQLFAHLGGPVGMDHFGFGITDSGHIVHAASKTQFLNAGNQDALIIGPGTIIGIMVHIPRQQNSQQDELYSEQIVFMHDKRHFLQYKLAPSLPAISNTAAIPEKIPGSYMRIYVNGRDCGVAFANLPKAAAYFPMFSVYREGRVTVNFGPRFVYTPAGRYRPWCELQKV